MISKPSTTRSIQFSKSKDSGLQTDKSSTSVASRSGRIFKTPIRRFFRLEMLKPSSSSTSNINSTTPDETNQVSQAIISSPFKQLSIRPDTNTSMPSTTITIQGPDTIDNTKETQTSHNRSPAEHNSHSQSSTTSSPIACMALQNSDHSVDAIIISTLVKLPFCCHEDLLTMSESRILEVGKEMNERLPSAMRIELDLNNGRKVEEVRKEIERLVGIVKKATKEVSVPRAPLKRAKSKGQTQIQGQIRRQSLSFDQDNAGGILDHLDLTNISPPTSPLANISQTRRSKRRSGVADITMILTPTKLEMLREEDEGLEVDLNTPETVLPLEMFGPKSEGRESAGRVRTVWKNDFSSEDVFRAFKKRKMIIQQPIENHTQIQQRDRDFEMITPTMREIKSPLQLKKMYYGNSESPQQDVSPTPSHRRKPRTRSQTKLQVMNMAESDIAESMEDEQVIIKTTTVTDRSLIHARPRYRTKVSRTTPDVKYSDDLDLQPGPLQTSTPKRSRHRRRPATSGIVSGRKDGNENGDISNATS